MARAKLFALVLPLSAAGILAGHAAAYELAGGGAAGLHHYLEHVPQVLLALLLPSLALAAGAGGRGGACVGTTQASQRPRPWAFALLGAAGFVVMEHLERLAQGQLPWLLTSPVFLLGLALQLPFALAAWRLARALLALPRARRLRPRLLARIAFPVQPLPCALAKPSVPATAAARAPPQLL